MSDLTPEQREVLLALVDLAKDRKDNFVRDIARHAGLTMNQTTDCLRDLNRAKLATWTSPKGWIATSAGEYLCRQLEKAA